MYEPLAGFNINRLPISNRMIMPMITSNKTGYNKMVSAEGLMDFVSFLSRSA